MEPKDSRPDTEAHINRVQELLGDCVINLSERGEVHDASKLQEPEKSAFDRLAGLKLSGMKYGSPEYRECLRAEKPAIQHHYAANSHHPEFYQKRDGGVLAIVLRAAADEQLAQAQGVTVDLPDPEAKARDAIIELAKLNRSCADQIESSVNGMSLLDIIEMLVDWKAASERMEGGGDIMRSIELNVERFALNPQMANILINTARELGWIPAVTKTP